MNNNIVSITVIFEQVVNKFNFWIYTRPKQYQISFIKMKNFKIINSKSGKELILLSIHL